MAQTAVRYSGSLLKYSFDEADHSKSVTVVEIDAKGTPSIRTVSLAPRRDVRKIQGRFEEVMRGPGSGESKEDYISVCLTDQEAIWDAMNRLRTVYPNVMQIISVSYTHLDVYKRQVMESSKSTVSSPSWTLYPVTA